MPWSAVQRWKRGPFRQISEQVCAENREGFYDYRRRAMPQAAKTRFLRPDFLGDGLDVKTRSKGSHDPGSAAISLRHVLISLVGIMSGFVVLFGLLAQNGSRMDGALSCDHGRGPSVTGFGFPIDIILASICRNHISGGAGSLPSSPAMRSRLAGLWRTSYVDRRGHALILNVFVFDRAALPKVPALQALAPTHPNRHSR